MNADLSAIRGVPTIYHNIKCHDFSLRIFSGGKGGCKGDIMKSIMDTRKGVCFLCKKLGYTEEHHIFGGPNRKWSEKYGLKVDLDPECHREGSRAAHRCRETAEELHRKGQQAFEKKYGSRELFIEIFGKNYL